MRIVLDLQGAQRGSAEKNFNFSLALISLLQASSTFVVLDGSFPEAACNIRKRFERLLPPENIKTWQSPSRSAAEIDSGWRDDADTAIRELLVNSLKPDAVIIPVETFNDVQFLRLKRFRTKSIFPVLLCIRTSVPSSRHSLPQVVDVDAIAVFGSDLEPISESSSYGRPVKSYAEISPNPDFISDLDELIKSRPTAAARVKGTRGRLALVTPMPPARSGISDYAVEFCHSIAPYYNVTMIVESSLYEHVDKTSGLNVEDDIWFAENHTLFDRVIYNFGNSPFHCYMDVLLDIAPGIVVMHDFFLADLFYSVDKRNGTSFAARLCEAHGYRPLIQMTTGMEISQLVSQYPLNSSVVNRAHGLIVHSDTAKSLATKWFGERCADDWSVIPLPRKMPSNKNKAAARDSLNIDVNDFVVSSFGLITANKQTEKLIEAWLASKTSSTEGSTLFLIGELTEQPFGSKVSEMVRGCPAGKVILVGWVDQPTYSNYLAASDVAVQLRTATRGETSAAALDTMKCGVATIVNANGSMADLPDHTVVKIPNDFAVQDLTDAIDRLFEDSKMRHFLGQEAKAYVAEVHSTERVAAECYDCVERIYQDDLLDTASIAAGMAPLIHEKGYASEYAEALASTLAPRSRRPTLFLDVSAIIRDDLRTGIQRVVRAIVSELLKQDRCLPVYPIYMSDEHNRWKYRYAHKWTLNEIGFDNSILDDQPVEFIAGDKLLIVDFTGPILYIADRDSDVYRRAKSAGVEISAIIYDILPVKFPDLFPEYAAAHAEWLRAVGRLVDRVICISKSVADDVHDWYNEQGLKAPRLIRHFHLGADIKHSSPTLGVSIKVDLLLPQLRESNTFLVVGTLEPRKRHSQILDGFEGIWRRGIDCNLVFVGKLGWMSGDLESRLDGHQERSKRLHWLHGVTDEELEKIYAASSCLIAASVDEGFGLPLIEAAQFKVPIIARDIPVFREVGGRHVSYFRGDTGEDLATAVLDWLALYKTGSHQRSDEMPWLTWRESAKQLLANLFDDLPFAETKKSNTSTPTAAP